MKATPAAPTPIAGVTAYSLGFLTVILPAIILSGAVVSLDVGAIALGGVFGSTQFEFKEDFEDDH